MELEGLNRVSVMPERPGALPPDEVLDSSRVWQPRLIDAWVGATNPALGLVR